MQVYAGLPIVTNQPDEARAPRRATTSSGWRSPQQECSVAEYAAVAHEVMDRLRGAGRPVVVEGGSGLYLRAALGDLSFGGAPDEARRRALGGALGARSRRCSWHELRRRDPATSRRASTRATRGA